MEFVIVVLSFLYVVLLMWVQSLQNALDAVYKHNEALQEYIGSNTRKIGAGLDSWKMSTEAAFAELREENEEDFNELEEDIGLLEKRVEKLERRN